MAAKGATPKSWEKAMWSSGNLNKFVTESIQVPVKNLESYNKAVDEIVTFLQPESPWKIRRVYKSGSLVKGTSVKDHVGVDLYVYIELPETQNDPQSFLRCAPQIVEDIAEKFASSFKWQRNGKSDSPKKSWAVVAQDYENEKGYPFIPLYKCHKDGLLAITLVEAATHMNKSKYSSQQRDNYSLRLAKETKSLMFDMDINVVFDLYDFLKLPAGQFDHSTAEKVFRYIKAQPNPSEFAAQFCPSLAELNFMGTRLKHFNGDRNSNGNLKKLILWVKYWFKKKVKPGIKFKSVLLELVCLHVWETKLRHMPFDLVQWLEEIMTALIEYEKFNCVWTMFYDQSIVPSSLLKERPLILDPENPWRNMASKADWCQVKKSAQQFVKARIINSNSISHKGMAFSNAPASGTIRNVEYVGQRTQEDNTYTSIAPAGGTYRNVEHAGHCTLEANAHGFQDTDKSTMIPPMFVTKYPEPVEEKTGEIIKTTRALTKKEENRFTGVSRNASGEEAEYKAFKVFERLIQMKNDPPLLIMRNFVLQNFRADVLALELGIDFDGIHTVAEFDAVVVVKDTGLILVEVKRQFTEEQKLKAEDQLENGKLFFQRIMSHITGPEYLLPVVKVIMFPDEEAVSPTLKSDHDTHIVHKDLMLNFNRKWKDLISELEPLKPGTSFSGEVFQQFTGIITGMWSMEKYQKRFYIFDNKEASSTYLLQQNDEMINRAVLTSDVRTAKNESKIVEPVTDVEHCAPQDGFPACSGMNLIYLTPEQKDLYQNVPQAIIRGSAGSGKTLLAYLKIVDILQNHSNKKILILAPDPHHLRMEQFIKSNGGQTTVTEYFTEYFGGVVIMTLHNFFKVPCSTLQSYDVSMYHVFIDDLQSLDLDSSSNRFDDILHFIKRCYTNLIGGNQLFWCAIDVGQKSTSLGGTVTNKTVSYLFNVDDTTPRKLTIPIYILNKTLRNSVEISTVVQKVREMRVAKHNASSYVLTKITTGHRIRSETVTYHKLTKWRSTGDGRGYWEKYGVPFAVERVKDELEKLLNPQKHDMKLNDIAILYDTVGHRCVEEPLPNMLLSTFNITPQTIKQFIMTSNNTIILDKCDNVASFECRFVLYLCGFMDALEHNHYNMMTRARTKLVVVDFDNQQPLLTDDVILIEWEERDGTFYRL